MEQKQRNAFFDNFKAFLIIVVVLGHILEIFLNKKVILDVYKVIYAFHMPAFVFIAGYFSKNIEKQEGGLFFDFLIPYFVFNSFFQILLWRTMEINIFEPIYAYWFLLSMFFWKSSLKKIVNIRFIILISVLISLYAGFFSDVSRYLSVSRTLIFFPYFLAGYFCSQEIITKIKSLPRFIGFVSFFCATLILMYFFDRFNVPAEILKGADSYGKLELAPVMGLLTRLILIFIASAFIFSLINLIPEKKLKITYIGKNTLVIYLFHPFFILIIQKFSELLIYQNVYVEIILYIALAILISLVLSIPIISKMYNVFFSKILKILKKNNPIKFGT
ncbi:Fucose 4-O-acetylase [Flavobacterium resistens]|uniref:Acyltransferase family protein n=1 Tax=Flavobacterium resistens TaxID=443612 RepID=A0A521DWJ8_9FLAO|nr:acyltransferase family protein [Flavobacterium resistens]MRX68163.1 acyltransferase family protein [Flavobacterium resistens]SMO75250.1 Fucose 4-O-acetylase [Flavobacterium resistens]